MNQRFNFYDIYGYLLPGGLMLFLLWLPFGLLLGQWPTSGWSSTILALGLAYIAGHFLHALSEAAFPSKFKDSSGNKRHPSDLLVDDKDEEVLQSRYRLGGLKKHLEEQIDSQFGIKIDINHTWTKEIGTLRSVAFFKCRSYLIEKKAAVYAEQQQGMYALMRGVGAAFILSCGLYIGMAIEALFNVSISTKWMFAILLIILALTLIIALCSLRPLREEKARKASFWLLAIVLLCGGILTSKAAKAAILSDVSLPSKLELSLQNKDDLLKYIVNERAFLSMHHVLKIQEHETCLMFAMAMIAAILSLISISAFHAFAVNFAATVYRDFSTYAPLPKHKIREQECKPNVK